MDVSQVFSACLRTHQQLSTLCIDRHFSNYSNLTVVDQIPKASLLLGKYVPPVSTAGRTTSPKLQQSSYCYDEQSVHLSSCNRKQFCNKLKHGSEMAVRVEIGLTNILNLTTHLTKVTSTG